MGRFYQGVLYGALKRGHLYLHKNVGDLMLEDPFAIVKHAWH
jgi:hypothetical protein